MPAEWVLEHCVHTDVSVDTDGDKRGEILRHSEAAAQNHDQKADIGDNCMDMASTGRHRCDSLTWLKRVRVQGRWVVRTRLNIEFAADTFLNMQFSHVLIESALLRSSLRNVHSPI